MSAVDELQGRARCIAQALTDRPVEITGDMERHYLTDYSIYELALYLDKALGETS